MPGAAIFVHELPVFQPPSPNHSPLVSAMYDVAAIRWFDMTLITLLLSLLFITATLMFLGLWATLRLRYGKVGEGRVWLGMVR